MCWYQECSLLLFIVGLWTVRQLLSSLATQSGAWGTFSERALPHFTGSRENQTYFIFSRGCCQDLWLCVQNSKRIKEDSPKYWTAVCNGLHFPLYYFRNYIHNNLFVFWIGLFLITKSLEGFQTKVPCSGYCLVLTDFICMFLCFLQIHSIFLVH